MLPEEMLGGRRMDGNSIWDAVSCEAGGLGGLKIATGGAYETFIMGQEDRNSGINLTNGEGDQHFEIVNANLVLCAQTPDCDTFTTTLARRGFGAWNSSSPFLDLARHWASETMKR
jgi:hypothetical protein